MSTLAMMEAVVMEAMVMEAAVVMSGILALSVNTVGGEPSLVLVPTKWACWHRAGGPTLN